MELNDPLNQTIFEELKRRVKLVLLFSKRYFAKDRNICSVAMSETRPKKYNNYSSYRSSLSKISSARPICLFFRKISKEKTDIARCYFRSIFGQCSRFIPPENAREPFFFLCFQGV